MANNLSSLDANQVIRNVHDEDSNSLRVSVVNDSGDPDMGVEVVISHTDDSIRLGDGTSLVTSTTVGADVGLDVNLINQDLDTRDLDANQDNVAISDGTNTASVTPEGRLNVSSIALFTMPYDAITVTYPSDTQEVYASRVGGIAGTVQQTITINYTDSTKNFITNVART